MQRTSNDQEAPLVAALLANEVSPAGDQAAAAAAGAGAHCPVLSPSHSRSSLERSTLHTSHAWEVLHEVVLPVAILVLGVGFSVAALWVAVLAVLPS